MSDRSQWNSVKELMGERSVTLGRHTGYWFTTTPRRTLHSMSYYKFAAKMIGKGKQALDIGCGEGLGTWLLACECGKATGLDSDQEAIAVACGNWREESIRFVCGDFLEFQKDSMFDAVVNFDVLEHIYPEHAAGFIDKIAEVLKPHGIAVIGTPSLPGQQYASEVAKTGHVNVYSFERLRHELQCRFTHVFMFCANDEIVHTGYPELAHYYIAVCCRKKNETDTKLSC